MLSNLSRYLFYLFIFLLPLQTRYFFVRAYLGGYEWEAGSLVIYATEVLLWLILLLVFIELVRNKFWQKINLARIKKPAPWLISLFIGWSGLSIWWSVNGQVAYWHWFKLIEAIAVGSLLLILSVDLKKLAAVLSASGAAQGLLAFWQFASQQVVVNKWLGVSAQSPADLGVSVVETGGRYLRAYGSFPHPNILGGWLVITLIFTVYLVLNTKRLKFILLSLISLVIQLFGLVLTFSRAAIGTFILIMVIYFLAAAIKKWHPQIILVTGVTIVLSLAVSFWLWQPLLMARFSQERLEIKSYNERATSLRQAIVLIKQRPLNGWGIGSYQLALAKLNPGQAAYQYLAPHNFWLLLTAELGIIGFLAWLLIYGLALKQILQPTTVKRPLWLGLWLAVLLLTMFDYYWWTNWSLLVIFWLVVYTGRFKTLTIDN